MSLSSTPPNWPIHGVECQQDQVEQIARHVYPKSQLLSMRELEKGKSFNNRIYFLTFDYLDNPSDSPEIEKEETEIVLKLPGRFFGSTKIQNEVAVLLLLEKHCPSVPAPRILAWSNDGSRICAIQNGVFAVLYDADFHEPIYPTMNTGWIMMSKLPGRALTKSELHATDDNLISDLARYVSTWRRDMPKRENIGNMLLSPAGYTSSDDLYGLESVVHSTLHLTQPKQPMTKPIDLYNHLLTDQINKLHTNESFLALRETIPRLEHFRKEVLPKLIASVEASSNGQESSVEGDKDYAVFTHQDIAPRNILVVDDDSTPSKLRISGILDFEFAGFFPPEEEFLTCIARQADDWEETAFAAFLKKLFQMGIERPCGGVETAAFKTLCDLVRLIEYCAPWHLESGCIKGDELLKQLEVAKMKSEVLLDQLESLAPTD